MWVSLLTSVSIRSGSRGSDRSEEGGHWPRGCGPWVGRSRGQWGERGVGVSSCVRHCGTTERLKEIKGKHMGLGHQAENEVFVLKDLFCVKLASQ